MADEGARTKAHTVTEFLEEAREHMRKRHLSLKTERAYLYRMRQFIEFVRVSSDWFGLARLGPC